MYVYVCKKHLETLRYELVHVGSTVESHPQPGTIVNPGAIHKVQVLWPRWLFAVAINNGVRILPRQPMVFSHETDNIVEDFFMDLFTKKSYGQVPT